MSYAKRLVLGSANFGMEYGIAFGSSVPKDEVFRILDKAQKADIFGIDTAHAYGSAEEVIGEYIRERQKTFKVLTKVPHENYKSPREIKLKLLESLRRLSLPKVDYLLIHSYRTFEERRELVKDSIKALLQEGLVGSFGISVYHPWEAVEFLEVFEPPFAVQFPLNVFDKRFAPYIKEWSSMGLELFARSVFLQGLFFLPEERLTGTFERVRGKIKRLRELSESLKVSLACLCLSFALSFEALKVVIGVNSLEQFLELLSCPVIDVDLDSFEVEDEDIILPYRWR